MIIGHMIKEEQNKRWQKAIHVNWWACVDPRGGDI